MDNTDEMVTNDDGQQSTTADSEQADDDDSSPEAKPQRPVATFSVAQALSMVRQRREEQDRCKQEEEKQLEEQRRAKAKEKRKRRRKNQKERKAKIRETAGSSKTPTVADVSDTGDDGSDVVMDNEGNQLVGSKRSHDHETDDDGQSNDDTNIKSLPMKKRMRIKSNEASPTIAGPISLGESKTIQSKVTATKKITSFLPRALLLKSSKR
jgi:hypothetical protein